MKLALSFVFFAIALVQMTAAAPVVDNSVEQDLESRGGVWYTLDWHIEYESPKAEVVEKRTEQNLESRIKVPYDLA
ncbi:uncharacterized protein EDB91DRAFT_1166564 [Suillus paluster]|uniref:uncharacterized protein n=1 Tax=Suillus paluster TaxID=48578 RepID=UPI001B8764BA|nr:uncharacterized protein EDB91DRAFT_1166564 [Suillus paluster]KAG1726282.1 hypothetical protein EDB91DRAFT_1166564 [Suillus paluster]